MSKIHLEAVTVCVQYSDFLAETIPYNLPHLDRWVIVTTEADEGTRELCRKWNLPCLLTDEVYRDGSKFNKGKAIVRGIDHLSCNGWVLHLDADIALPLHTKHALDYAHLDPTMIYGVDRIMVRNWEDWQKLKNSSYLRGGQFDYHCRITFPKDYEVGSRWASKEYGFCPIGAFQLWHGESDLIKGVHTKVYPSHHNDAARGDIQQALYYDRRKRALIPEIIAVHLESEPAALGANWKGRTTKKFGPKNTNNVQQSNNNNSSKQGNVSVS